MCHKDIPSVYLLSHIPKCYRAFCHEGGILPLCVCQTCRGETTHPGDRIQGGATPLEPQREKVRESSKRPAEEAPPASLPSPPKKPSTNTPARPTIDLEDPRFIDGTCCLLCRKKKSQGSLNVPYIHIGRYRTVMLCKKAHLNSLTEQKELSRLLELLFTAAKEEVVEPLRTLEEGSQEETEKEKEDGNEGHVVVCEGFLDLQDFARCSNHHDAFLYYLDEEEDPTTRHNFCRPTHLLRHLLKYHSLMGTGATKGRGTLGATERGKQGQRGKGSSGARGKARGGSKGGRKGKTKENDEESEGASTGIPLSPPPTAPEQSEAGSSERT